MARNFVALVTIDLEHECKKKKTRDIMESLFKWICSKFENEPH